VQRGKTKFSRDGKSSWMEQETKTDGFLKEIMGATCNQKREVLGKGGIFWLLEEKTTSAIRS